MALKIGVIGATGMAGRAITQEALDHGLQVRAFIHNLDKAKDMFGDQVEYVAKDVFDIQHQDIDDLDVVVDAFAPGDRNKAYQHVDLAARLVELAKNQDKPRLFFILGAGSLETGDGHRLIDKLETYPNKETFIETPRQQAKEYELLKNTTSVNWVAVSPSANFKPGAFADYELGNNTLMKNAAGKSEVASGTIGRVIVEEIINPAHHNERFTAVNK